MHGLWRRSPANKELDQPRPPEIHAPRRPMWRPRRSTPVRWTALPTLASMRRVLASVSAAVALLSTRSPAQSAQASAERQFHDQVAAHLAGSPMGALPPGDTLVSWAKQGPILFHTVTLSGTVVSSGLVRNDPFAGVLTTRWRDGRPVGFSVRWVVGPDTTVALDGATSTAGLSIAGTRSQVLPTPTGAWAIADYGMDEHLIPAALALPRDGRSYALAVLHPVRAQVGYRSGLGLQSARSAGGCSRLRNRQRAALDSVGRRPIVDPAPRRRNRRATSVGALSARCGVQRTAQRLGLAPLVRSNPVLNWTGANGPACGVAAAPQCCWKDGAAAQFRWSARQLRLGR